MNTKVLLTATILAVFVFGTIGAASVAFAQYMGNVGDSGQTGTYTLEEALALQRSRIASAEANPAAGSGTPVLSADGIFGAAAITAVVFGGISGALFLRSKSGKYAAMGRG